MRDAHPAGYHNAADEGRGKYQCTPVAEEDEDAENEDGAKPRDNYQTSRAGAHECACVCVRALFINSDYARLFLAIGFALWMNAKCVIPTDCALCEHFLAHHTDLDVDVNREALF